MSPVVGSIPVKFGPFFRLQSQHASARLSSSVRPPYCWAIMCSMWRGRWNAACGMWQYSHLSSARRRTAAANSDLRSPSHLAPRCARLPSPGRPTREGSQRAASSCRAVIDRRPAEGHQRRSEGEKRCAPAARKNRSGDLFYLPLWPPVPPHISQPSSRRSPVFKQKIVPPAVDT